MSKRKRTAAWEKKHQRLIRHWAWAMSNVPGFLIESLSKCNFGDAMSYAQELQSYVKKLINELRKEDA